jgi:DNA-binding HxlR family transcriptional regulator
LAGGLIVPDLMDSLLAHPELAELDNPDLLQATAPEIKSNIDRAMKLIGEKYTCHIIHALHNTSFQRFLQLEERIKGISPRTLSVRLKSLEKAGLIRRTQFSTIPPRVEYALTEKGRDLANALASLESWADKWMTGSSKHK